MKKLITLALAACVTPAFAGMLIIGVDDAQYSLQAYDTNNMAAGPTALPINSAPWGLAGDNGNQILYSVNGSSLTSYAYGTWAQVQTGLTIADAAGAPLSFVSLGFNNANGKLYGTRNITTEAVYEIDTVTGVATQVYAYTAADFDFGGFDFDENGVAFGTNDDSTPGPAGLYELDLVNPPSLVAAYPAGENDIDGLAVGGGKAYLVEDDATATGSIHIYDFATNSYSSVATPWATSEVFSGAAYVEVVPEPTTITLLGLGALALLRKRRKS